MRISDWSSYVCSSDLGPPWPKRRGGRRLDPLPAPPALLYRIPALLAAVFFDAPAGVLDQRRAVDALGAHLGDPVLGGLPRRFLPAGGLRRVQGDEGDRKSTRLNSSH